jgi:hypothetical protein
MATKKPARRKGNIISIDFTGVKSGGGAIPDGRYAAKIIAVERKEGKESGEPYLELTWEVTSKKCNGREVRFDNYSLQPQALWRLKGMLEAMEVEIPDGEQDIDFDDLMGSETECIIEVTGQPSPDGDKTYARVTGHAPLSDGDTVDDDAEDEKPVRRKPAKDEDEDDEPPKRRKPTAKDDDEDEDEDEPPKRRASKKDDDDEEEDEDEKPSSKKVKKGAKVKFKDEKNKLTKGVIDSIDGDTAVVTSDSGDYEISIDELTVVG